MIVEPFIGLEFDRDHRNCWHLVRDFYKANYQIELSDYASPTNWWAHDIDLFGSLAKEEGFYVVNDHPMNWKPGDVICMAIGSKVGNHLGILIPGNKMLHHLVDQISCIHRYGSLFRDTTVAVYRHVGVSGSNEASQVVSLESLLPPHARRRLEKILADQKAQADPFPGR